MASLDALEVAVNSINKVVEGMAEDIKVLMAADKDNSIELEKISGRQERLDDAISSIQTRLDKDEQKGFTWKTLLTVMILTAFLTTVGNLFVDFVKTKNFEPNQPTKALNRE